MGTHVHLVAHGARDTASCLGAARRLIENCEARWSRFRPDSELSRLNAGSGNWVVVSPETFVLIEAAIAGWTLTEGRFDPTVLPALVAAGYDRTFDSLAASPPAAFEVPQNEDDGGCDAIRLDRERHSIRLPAGVAVDLGGIAKGHTADLVAEELMRLGTAGAVANIGGDVRVAGRAPDGEAWRVAIEDPLGDGTPLATCAVADGAVATTSRRRRHWKTTTGSAHHLIDPTTKQPAASGLLAVTVVAARGVWAEVLAKAAFLAGPHEAAAVLADFGTTGLLALDDGSVDVLPGMDVFLV
jgi:thiamine biosynthesis lipoprotein